MNRLVDSSYDGRKESFTYDKVGNRLTKTTNNITEQYVYNVKNQLKEIQKENTKNIFTYDKQGNTIKEETSSGNNLFEYNTLNQQIKAVTKDGNTLVNRYDAEGLRYEIEENEKLSRFIFNKNANILVETDSEDNVVSRFARGYEIVAADIRELDKISNSSTNSNLSDRYYYSIDEQGSTDFITDVNGNIKNEYWYDAFGNVLDSREKVHNRITYTGQQFDNISQQYYLRARFYNPIIGRFTQEDAYRGDGLNLYAYCGNNPVRYWDPSGYNQCDSKIQAVSEIKYPPRTKEARMEAQKVAKTMEGVISKNDSPCITVFTHENGTVSVGMSGQSGGNKITRNANKLQEKLGDNYVVSSTSMPTENLKQVETGCSLGNCSEPKAANAAHNNSSPITVYDTVWRGKGENPHKFTGENIGDEVIGDYEQMDNCDTCADPHNIKEYMNYANGNK